MLFCCCFGWCCAYCQLLICFCCFPSKISHFYNNLRFWKVFFCSWLFLIKHNSLSNNPKCVSVFYILLESNNFVFPCINHSLVCVLQNNKQNSPVIVYYCLFWHLCYHPVHGFQKLIRINRIYINLSGTKQSNIYPSYCLVVVWLLKTSTRIKHKVVCVRKSKVKESKKY